MTFARLFGEAERVRWSLEALPWDRIDRARVTPELVELVREIAASEATTFSATQRFLHDFADDVELTNWIAVWFYEETKHPYVLMRWLEALGENQGTEAMRRARVTAPFLKSRMAMLASNIISEIVASTRYANLAERSPEPVLGEIAKNLASDEARHAASFYTFARQRIDQASEPDVERRDALKVLYLWLQEGDGVRHPVNLFRSTQTSAAAISAMQSRVIHTIGLLVDARAPLRTAEDVMARLKGGTHGTS